MLKGMLATYTGGVSVSLALKHLQRANLGSAKNTAQKYLDRLVSDGHAERIRDGRRFVYMRPEDNIDVATDVVWEILHDYSPDTAGARLEVAVADMMTEAVKRVTAAKDEEIARLRKQLSQIKSAVGA